MGGWFSAEIKQSQKIYRRNQDAFQYASLLQCSGTVCRSDALWGNQSVNDYLVPGGRIYEQREYIYKALTDIPGITAVKPQAAFYMFPKIDVKKFNIVNDEKFALDLLQDKKI